MKRYLAVATLFALLSCKPEQKGQTGPWFSVPSFINAEKARLKIAHPRVNKTLVWGEELRSAESDSVDWDQELALWDRMDLNRAEWASTFDTSCKRTLDGGRFVLYETRDEKPALRSVSLLYNASGELLVLEADWEEHALWMHRSYRLSYLPAKGYSVKGWQQGLWEDRKEFEIFSDIQNKSFLNH